MSKRKTRELEAEVESLRARVWESQIQVVRLQDKYEDLRRAAKVMRDSYLRLEEVRDSFIGGGPVSPPARSYIVGKGGPETITFGFGTQ